MLPRNVRMQIGLLWPDCFITFYDNEVKYFVADELQMLFCWQICQRATNRR